LTGLSVNGQQTVQTFPLFLLIRRDGEFGVDPRPTIESRTSS
jgi:hypothetical protein